MSIFFLCFNAIVAFCLVWTKNHTHSRIWLELLGVNVSVELKGEGLPEASPPPAEVQENALYGMYMSPEEVVEFRHTIPGFAGT